MQYPAHFAQVGQQITQIILTTPEPETLLARVARALGEMFQVDICLVATIANSAAMPQVAFWAADGNPAIHPRQQAKILAHPALKHDQADTAPLGIFDLHAVAVDNAKDGLGNLLPIRAVLKIYTQYQSSVNGMIVLGQAQPYNWTSAHKEMLIAVSESVAVAISQAQLMMQVLAATRHQTLLNQLSEAIHRTIDPSEILQIAIASTAQALQVDRGLILLLKSPAALPKNQFLEHLPKTEITVVGEWFELSPNSSIFATNSPNPLLNQSFWLSDSSLCQQAFRSAPEPIVLVDQQDASGIDVSTKNFSILEQEMMPALLMIPLVGTYSHISLEPTLLGFMVLQHSQSRSWQIDQVELVKWVSAQLSATLSQYQTLQQVQSLVADRTAQLQHSLEVQAKLYEKTRQQIDQLQQLNLLKDEFLSSMSHELRTPLTTMSLGIRMLRQPQLSSERREKYLEILEQECNKEIDLINDLLSLQRLESNQSQLQPQKIDLMLLLQKLAKAFEEKWANKRLTLTLESPVPSLMFNTDPDSLNRILLELLTNAGKYSDPNTTICLQVTHQVQQSINQVVLTLSNTGLGISPTDLTHIFEKFHRGQGVTQKAFQGTGLGLALVKCLVEHLNGKIEATSSPLNNSQTHLTAFTLTLPQLQRIGE